MLNQIKDRLKIFFILLIVISPSIYFYGMYATFKVLPLEISFKDHMMVYHSILNHTTNEKLQFFMIIAGLVPFASFFKMGGNNKGEHGSADFATKSIIKKMNLNFKNGVLLGMFESNKLYYKEHIACLVLAPPGSGKSVSISIPNLLNFEESAFVLDVKGELYDKTSAYREKILKNKIYKFNPASFDTLKFNPFDKNVFDGLEWFEKENIVDEIAILIYPKSESGKDDFFPDSARNLFTLFALYLIDLNGFSSIPEIRKLILDDYLSSVEDDNEELDKLELFNKFIDDNMTAETLNIRVQELANSFLKIKGNTPSSVIASATTALEIFGTTTVKECFSSNNINILDFRKNPSTLYITIEEKDLQRFSVLLNLFIEFLLRQLLSNVPEKKDLCTLMVLDEFPRFGKIPYLINLPELGRSYKLITMLIAQDYGQIQKVYGQEQIGRINTSTAYKVIFPQTNYNTAKILSDLVGHFTRESVSKSRSSGIKSNKSTSTQLTGTALITAQDILNMNKKDIIYILVQNFYKNPIKGKQFRYYNDKKMLKNSEMIRDKS